MTKHQKQLSISVVLMVTTFTIMFITYPTLWVGAILILPCYLSFVWTLIVLAEIAFTSKLAKWLSEST